MWLMLTAIYQKIGITVAEVRIAWGVKEDLTKVKAEHDRSAVGHKEQRDDRTKIPVLSFPPSGSVKDV